MDRLRPAALHGGCLAVQLYISELDALVAPCTTSSHHRPTGNKSSQRGDVGAVDSLVPELLDGPGKGKEMGTGLELVQVVQGLCRPDTPAAALNRPSNLWTPSMVPYMEP